LSLSDHNRRYPKKIGLALQRLCSRVGRDLLPSIFEVLIHSIYIMENRITVTGLQVYPPDLLIRQAGVDGILAAGFNPEAGEDVRSI